MAVEKRKSAEKRLKNKRGGMAERFKAADCKSVEFYSSQVQILFSPSF
jgi:hypothetical protein